MTTAAKRKPAPRPSPGPFRDPTTGGPKVPPPDTGPGGIAGPKKTAPATAAPGAGLDTTQQNAYAILQGMLKQWGLDSLASTVLDLLKQGYNDPTAITYQLSQTDAYKQRFAANDTRIKNGLAPLAPAEYLAAEASYKQVMRQAGMPVGFYDQPSDFSQFIGMDVSPTEIQSRATAAMSFANSTDPNTRAQLNAYYGIDDAHLAAYFLDSQRALPLLQRQANAANIGAGALGQHLASPDVARAEHFADIGVTADQARQGYGTIAQLLPEEQRIAERLGTQYTQANAEDELFGGLASAARKRKQLNDSETARFAGSGGVGNSFYHPDYGLSQSASGAF